MISHIIEFSCQYSNDVRKKHKIWHDGKLRYYQLNNKFTLHSLDNMLLSSKFVTNQRDINCYLDEENFDLLEHRIFGSYVVIISEQLKEYDKEIQHVKTNSNVITNTVESASNNKDSKNPNKLPITKPTIPNNEKTAKNRNGMSVSGLVLKFNKPFKPPKRIEPHVKSSINRPNVRNSAVVKQQLNAMPDSTEDNNISMNISDDLFPSTQYSCSDGLLNFTPPENKPVSTTKTNHMIVSTPSHEIKPKYTQFVIKNKINENIDIDIDIDFDINNGIDVKEDNSYSTKCNSNNNNNSKADNNCKGDEQIFDLSKTSNEKYNNKKLMDTIPFNLPLKCNRPILKLKKRPGFKVRKIIHSPLIIPK